MFSKYCIIFNFSIKQLKKVTGCFRTVHKKNFYDLYSKNQRACDSWGLWHGHETSKMHTWVSECQGWRSLLIARCRGADGY